MDRLTAAKVFIDVAHSGSFTDTADRLNMSRPMVTRYVEALENWLQTRLLHRTTRRVTLTTAGQQNLEKIENWLNVGEALTDVVGDATLLSGQIKVSTSMSFGFAQLVPATKHFMQLHPEINIEIFVDDSHNDLVEQQIDLSIRIASNPDSSLIGKPIGVCRSLLVASPEYLNQSASIEKPTDLLRHSCLGYKHFERHTWHLTNGEQYEAIEIKPRLSANEATVLRQAACEGIGISLQPTYLVENELVSGQLVHILPEWKPNDLQIYALYSSRKHLSSTTRAFIDYLADYFQQSLSH